MARPKEDKDEVRVDPQKGDAILKQMLHTKPKPHSEMVGKTSPTQSTPKKAKSKPTPKDKG